MKNDTTGGVAHFINMLDIALLEKGHISMRWEVVGWEGGVFDLGRLHLSMTEEKGCNFSLGG